MLEPKWLEIENKGRKKLTQLRKGKEEIQVAAEQIDRTTQEIRHKERKMTEDEIENFIRNDGSIYDKSKEEPTAVYYDDKGILKIVRMEDQEMTREKKFRLWKGNKLEIYDEQETGIGTITVSLNKNKKGKIKQER